MRNVVTIEAPSTGTPTRWPSWRPSTACRWSRWVSAGLGKSDPSTRCTSTTASTPTASCVPHRTWLAEAVDRLPVTAITTEMFPGN